MSDDKVKKEAISSLKAVWEEVFYRDLQSKLKEDFDQRTKALDKEKKELRSKSDQLTQLLTDYREEFGDLIKDKSESLSSSQDKQIGEMEQKLQSVVSDVNQQWQNDFAERKNEFNENNNQLVDLQFEKLQDLQNQFEKKIQSSLQNIRSESSQLVNTLTGQSTKLNNYFEDNVQSLSRSQEEYQNDVNDQVHQIKNLMVSHWEGLQKSADSELKNLTKKTTDKVIVLNEKVVALSSATNKGMEECRSLIATYQYNINQFNNNILEVLDFIKGEVNDWKSESKKILHETKMKQESLSSRQLELIDKNKEQLLELKESCHKIFEDNEHQIANLSSRVDHFDVQFKTQNEHLQSFVKNQNDYLLQKMKDENDELKQEILFIKEKLPQISTKGDISAQKNKIHSIITALDLQKVAVVIQIGCLVCILLKLFAVI